MESIGISFADVLTLLVLLAVMAFVSYRSAKKSVTTDDYLAAGRSLGRIQAGFSMAATDIGGNSVVGAVAFAYGTGLGGVWYNWGAVLPLFILAFILAGQRRSLDINSVPELLGKRYNGATRLLATVTQLLAMGVGLGGQFAVAGSTLSTVLGVSHTVGIMISVVILIMLTSGGGLLAVVNDDVVMFLIICLSIVIAIPVCLSAGGGWETISRSLPEGYLDIGSQGILLPVSLGLLFMFDYGTQQSYLQRVLSAKDESTARFAYMFTGSTYIFFGLAVAFLGVLAYALLPNLDNSTLAYATMIKEYMPAGVRGLVLGGIFAAAMSSADSKIVAAASLFINDIYQTHIRKGTTGSDRELLRISRFTAASICVLGIVVSMFSQSLIQIMYTVGLFYSTAVFIPMLAALYWKQATAAGALTSMISSIIVGLYFEYFVYGKADGLIGTIPSNLIAIAISLILFVIVSLLTERQGGSRTQ